MSPETRSLAKGVKSATYKTRLPENGLYRVLISYTPGDNRATNVPVDVYSADGSKTVFVNQKQTPPLAGFIDVGEYTFKADQDAVVIIANTETNGHVIIDAVQFLTPDDFKLVLEDAKKNPVAVVKPETPKPAPEPPKPAPEPPREEPKVAVAPPTTLATPISKAPLEFPALAYQRNIERGTVKARLAIDAGGRVTNVQIVSANPRRWFDE